MTHTRSDVVEKACEDVKFKVKYDVDLAVKVSDIKDLLAHEGNRKKFKDDPEEFARLADEGFIPSLPSLHDLADVKLFKIIGDVYDAGYDAAVAATADREPKATPYLEAMAEAIKALAGK